MLNLASTFKQALDCPDADWVMASSSAIHTQAAAIKATDPKRLVIACQGRHGSGVPEHSSGLELVLWLRLEHKVKCPILLVGFLSDGRVRSSRTERTERFLLHAPGIRYVQLPVPPDQWPELKDWLDNSSITEEDIVKEYPAYLRAGFDIGNFRHALANKFGLKAAWDIHDLLFQRRSYPTDLAALLSADKDLLLAEVLYPLPVSALQNLIRERRHRIKQEGTTLRERLGALEQAIRDNTLTHAQAIERVMDLVLTSEMLLLESGNVEYPAADKVAITDRSARRWAEALEAASIAGQLDEALVLDRMQATEMDFQLAEIKENLGRVPDEVRNDLVGDSDVPSIRNTLRVLHVDDELEIGWADLMRRVIDPSNEAPPNYVCLQPTNKDLDGIVQEVLIAIQTNPPDIVLLDLRLRGVEDQGVTQDAPPSGVHVLRAIRQKHKTLPVIITTASNKLWSYRMVMREGADGYWLKQGVELGWGAAEVFGNYVDLRWMISIADRPLVRAMRKLEQLHAWMRHTANQWWSQGRWASGEQRKGHTPSALLLLNMAIVEFRAYCQGYVFREIGLVNTSEVQWAVSPICTRLGGVVERITIDGQVRYLNGAKGPPASNHPSFEQVMAIRNNASHGKAPFNITQQSLIDQVIALDVWLKSMGRNGSGTP